MHRRLALVLALAASACGDGIERPDAPPPPDATGGMVSIRVIDTTGGVVNPTDIEVYFQAADSRVVLATHANARGEANAFMPPGGFVTVVLPTGTMTTYVDPRPGDHLVFGGAGFQELDLTTMLVTIPPNDQAFSFTLITPCGSFSIDGADRTPLPVTLDSCGDTTAMLVLANTSSGTDYLYLDEVPVVSQDTVAFVGPYTHAGGSTITVTNVPPAVTNLSINHALVAYRRSLLSAQDFPVPVGGATTTILDLPQPPTGTLVTTVDSVLALGNVDEHVIQWAPAAPFTQVDLGRPVRPYLDAPRFDPTTSRVTWTEGEGQLANFVIAEVDWSDELTFWRWTIVSPRGEAAAVTYPVLPDLRLAPTNPFVQQLYNLVVDGDALLDRPTLLGWAPGGAWPITGATGRVTYRSLGFGAFPPD